MDLGQQPLTPVRNALTFDFKDPGQEPGVYIFEFPPIDEKQQADSQAYAFNVDTAKSNLKRATREMLVRNPPAPSPQRGIEVLSDPNSSFDIVVPKQSDVSEGSWFYLIILLVLIMEQALAVHLSFHLRESEAQLPAKPLKSQAA